MSISAFPDLGPNGDLTGIINWNPAVIRPLSVIQANSVVTNSVTTGSTTLTGVLDENNVNSLATINFVNNKFNAILGTDIAGQINENLDTILEIDGFISQMKTDVSQNITNIQTLNDALVEVNNEIIDLHDMDGDLSTNIIANTTLINDVSNNLLIVDNKYQTLTDDISTNIAMINTTISDVSMNLAAEITSTITRFNESNVKIDDISGNLEIANSLIIDLSGNFATYRTTNDALTSDLSSNIATNANNIATNTSSISNIDATVIDLSSNYYTFKTGTNSLLTDISNDIIAIDQDISTLTTDVANLSLNKLNKTDQQINNTHYINSGTNQIYNKVQTISSSGQCLMLSAGGFTENDVITFNRDNYTIIGPDSAFASASTVITNNQNIVVENCTRLRMSNVQIANNIVINNTTGRHTFKGVTFNGNFSLTNSNTNWLNFYYCTFSGEVNINNLFGGYAIFYFCDFAGATLNFNNVSNQQVYINSCINLPSLSLNGLLNGFNSTTTSSSINTVSLNCSGSVALPNDSVSISNINGLQSQLDDISTSIVSNTSLINDISSNLQSEISSNLVKFADISGDIVTINENVNTNTTNLTLITSQLANAITDISDISGSYYPFKSTTETSLSTINSTLTDISNNAKTYTDTQISSLQTSLQGEITDVSNNLSSYVDTSIAALVNSAPATLDTLNELSNALNNDPNFATTITNSLADKASLSSNNTFIGTNNFSGTLNLGGQNLATRLNNIDTSLNALTSGSNSNQTYTNPRLTDILFLNEKVFNAGSGGNLSLDFNNTNLRNVISYIPSSNFTLTLTNVNVTDTWRSYTLTFLFHSKFYINALNYNGQVVTITSVNGLSNTTIDPLSVYVIQTLSFIHTGSAVPNVISNISSLF